MGCRVRAAKATLLRVVAVEDQGTFRLAPDPDGRLPGRGAHVHPDPQCVELAGKRRAFGRALRLDHAPDLEPVRQHLQQVRDSATTTPPDESRSTTS